MFIDAELYSQIVQKIPIVCVDVILRIDDQPAGIYLDAFEKSSFSSHLYETVSLLVFGDINKKNLNSISLDKSILGWKEATDLPTRLNNKSFWLYPQSV